MWSGEEERRVMGLRITTVRSCSPGTPHRHTCRLCPFVVSQFISENSFAMAFSMLFDWDCCTIREFLMPIVYVPNLQLACPTALLLDFVISAFGTACATAVIYQEGPKRAFTSA